MLRYSFDLEEEAKAIESAVEKVLEEGYRTGDIYSQGTTKVGTDKMGDLICNKL
jgi:3-isopropylmalate dehydrogenase